MVVPVNPGVWIKRVWCVQSRYAVYTWTENSEHIRPRGVVSERAPLRRVAVSVRVVSRPD